MKATKALFFCIFLTLLAGCAINPVTGDRELGLVGKQQEIAIGSKQYIPGRQMQGGDFLVDPELSAYVSSVGQKLAAVSDRPLPYEFTILNNSTPNAWALPGGKIVINRGLLLELNNEAELAAVLSHEIVHAAARHGAKSMERGILLQGALLATALAARQNDYAGLAVGGAQLAAGLITQRYSREAELEADYYSMQYMSRAGYDVQSAVDLQETFVHLSEGRNQNWLTGLFSSHPPSWERVEANRKTARTLKKGGFIGREIYQQKTRRLQKTEPAYQAYDKARKALEKKDNRTAHALAEKAIEIEPSEASFYGLKGDVYFAQKKYSKALASYDRAIYFNDQFFNFYMQRGLTKEKLGDQQGASQDMARSTRLLPTATAYKKLGDFSLARGEENEAKRFFQSAASSHSSDGKAALLSFIRLDLPDNPNKYIRIQGELLKDGQVALRITNSSPLAVAHIKIKARYLSNRGEVKQVPLLIPRQVAPAESVLISLKTEPLPKKYLHNIEAQIVSLQVAK